MGGAPSGVGAALAQPGHQHIPGTGGDGQQRVIAPLAGIAVVSRALFGQTVGLTDGGIEVDGERYVAGARAGGPGPGQQLPAHPVELTVAPPEAAQEGAQSLPSRKRGVDGALTVPPRVQAVPPVRNTLASSMQSPPASAEATRVSILSPGFARPGASPIDVAVGDFTQAQVLGQGHREQQPGIAIRRWSSKTIWMRSGWLGGSIYWVLLFWDRFALKTIIPDSQEHPLAASGH